ncbi:glycosyltransferase [Terrabacter sp. GCM10028922]|uniref:CgeB family protein n=1 Tax=Terrabacter sp. GCM10028922 TaxID=3273428 RepID=UPI0036149249
MSSSKPLFDTSVSPNGAVLLGRGIKVLLPLDGDPVDVALDVSVPASQPGAQSPKALVAGVEFVNEIGVKVPAPKGWFSSKQFGSFRYVSAKPRIRVEIDPPASARHVLLTLAPWAMPTDGVTVGNAVTVLRRKSEASPDLRLGKILPVPSVVDLAPGSKADWVPLRSATPPVVLPVIGGQDLLLDIRLLRNVDHTEATNSPPALVNIEWFDAQGKSIASRGRISRNQRFGEFRYVKRDNGRPNLCLLQPPLTAVRGVVRLRRWGGQPGDVSFQRQAVVTFRGLQSRTQRTARPVRPVEKLRVAMVCDEFTYNSFAPEFDLLPLTPDGWREQLEEFQPDLFLCESAWAGPDSVARPWRGRVYASANFPRENRGELFGILEHCRDAGIPTAFWNKEDPSHYEDRRHDFVRTALLFDHIFTTALECVERYKLDYGHPSVHCLPFATQPRHFNPITQRERTDEVVFAGSWYNQHPARVEAMARIFDSVLDAGRDLVIFNRHHGDTDPNHLFPERYAPYLRPGVSHLEMADLYKRSRLGLNINTETASKTMFARRVFELMSSNTLVLSNHSAGMEDLFGDSVVFVDRDPDRLASLTDADIDRIREEALREVLSNHTYRHRVLQILDAVGIPYAVCEDRPALVTVISSAAEAESAIRAFSFLSSSADGLLLVVDDSVPAIEVRAYYRRFNRGGIRVVDQRLIGDGAGLGLGLAFDRVVLTSDIQSLTPEMLRDVRLHSSYMDERMAFATSPEDRYRFIEIGSEMPDHRVVRLRDLDAAIRLRDDRTTPYYAI